MNTAVKLICGETTNELSKLEDDSVDVSITSPPYNKGRKNKGWLVKEVEYANYKDALPEKDYQELQIKVLGEIYRVTKPGGCFFYNHKLRWDKGNLLHPFNWINKTKWAIRQEIIWNRKIAGNIRGWRFWNIDERIYWLFKPINNKKVGIELKSKHALLTSIWEITPERNNPHPAPFPIEIPTRIIYSILDENDGVVLDPYCGSGSTLVAAKILGKDYIGIDISQEYINLAQDRLDKFWKTDIIRLKKEIKLHTVKKTFKERKKEGQWKGKIVTGEQKSN